MRATTYVREQAGADSVVVAQGSSDVDFCRVCEHYFGKARQEGSHRIYKTPWQGDPRINIQDDKGKAKAYQVRQVIKAIRKLEGA